MLDWSAAETAKALDITVAAANSGLQRARATLESRREVTSRKPSERERALLAAFIDLHERGEVAGSLALMREDIRVTMPPHPMVYEGRSAIAPLLSQAFSGTMGEWHLLPARANRMPAAVSYLKRPGDSVYRAFKIDVLWTDGERVSEVTTFDTRLLDAFGMPARIPPARTPTEETNDSSS